MQVTGGPAEESLTRSPPNVVRDGCVHAVLARFQIPFCHFGFAFFAQRYFVSQRNVCFVSPRLESWLFAHQLHCPVLQKLTPESVLRLSHDVRADAGETTAAPSAGEETRGAGSSAGAERREGPLLSRIAARASARAKPDSDTGQCCDVRTHRLKDERAESNCVKNK